MLKSVSYFWSNAFNAFIFEHGPMIVTLADIHMLTGLRIIGPSNPMILLGSQSIRFKVLDPEGGEAILLCISRLETHSLLEHVVREVSILWVFMQSNFQLLVPSRTTVLWCQHPSRKMLAWIFISPNAQSVLKIDDE